MTTEYTDKDIKVLDDRDHVRLRTHNYLGNMAPVVCNIPVFGKTFKIKAYKFIPAVYRALSEVLDNSIDELLQHDTERKTIEVSAQPALGMYTIKDSGRGVPITIHEVGKRTPEVVFGSLRSGRNFKDEKDVGVKGMNGVGVSVVNFCSSEFAVDIERDGKRYRQRFSDGAGKVTNPSIRKTTSKNTGTSIAFQLDGDVFDDVSLPDDLIEGMVKEISFTNPQFTVKYNNKTFRKSKGFEGMVKEMSDDYFKFQEGNITFYVIFDAVTSPTEEIFSWVNSSLLLNGGICNTQFTNAFYDKAIEYLNSKVPKKDKAELKITKEHVRANLLIIGDIKVSDPQYDAQAKTRLVGPTLRKEMDQLVDNQWSAFSRKNKNWAENILTSAKNLQSDTENKKAKKDQERKIRSGVKIAGLTDATSKNRAQCVLVVTEGLSAASMITDVRDPVRMASLPLTGKINNVWGASIAQVSKMGKVADLITAIGLVPGKKATRSTLKYGQVIIATDSDVDGGHIMALLVNLFYCFWPELLDEEEPLVYRLVAPNVIASKGKQRVYFPSMVDFESKSTGYKGWTIEYIKGLGSLRRDDYEEILSDKKYLLPLTDDGTLGDTLELLFGPDTIARREWLQS